MHALESLFNLQGKVALVIGGGQGMGESSARHLALAGADVAVADLELGRAEQVAGMVRELGRRGGAFTHDVLVDSHAPRVIAKVVDRFGRLDVLVCIVGMASWAPLVEMTPEQWDLDQGRNLRYFFLYAREAAKVMLARDQPGSIVGICSVSGLQSAPQHAAYGAAKAGMTNLVKSMAVEWSPHGIRANLIAPGMIYTPRIAPTPEREAAARNGLVPMKRRGVTDEIGKAVLFMASDLSSYVTGQTLAVDGGWMAANIFEKRPGT